MVEQPHAGEYCHHAVLVTDFDDIIVSHAAARLCDIGYAALLGSFDVVAERKEGVAAEGDAADGIQIFSLLFLCKRLRFFCEQGLPYAVLQDILVLVPR